VAPIRSEELAQWAAENYEIPFRLIAPEMCSAALSRPTFNTRPEEYARVQLCEQVCEREISFKPNVATLQWLLIADFDRHTSDCNLSCLEPTRP
jgi:hypothetical protein